MIDSFKSDLEKILKSDKRLVDGNGELNANLIDEYASCLDEGLIELLLNEKATRDKFFLKIKDVFVFKQSDFKFFLDENKIDNSYTKYVNRIGLSTGGKFLKDINDVILNFPYKDCILEGGQSTEEGIDIYFEYDEEEEDYSEKQAKRKETFYNQVIAKDEIDRILEPKALVNIKCYTEKGTERITSFSRNKEGKITDNLLIRGNNLLALYSIKDEFKGRVKLIYIDPPYYFKEKQGDDAFAYNSNFKLSTWLTFMMNRLEIAFELLTPDGLIYVQTNEDGQSHLKVLMDNLFTEKRFVSQISWQRTSEGRSALGQGSSFIINSTEYILCYSNQKKPTHNLIKKRVEATEKALSQYSYLLKSEGKRKLEKTIKDSKGNLISIYKHSNYDYKGIPGNVKNEERLKNFEFLVREAAQQKESSLQQKILSELDPETLYSVEYTPTSGKNKGEERKAYYINGGILLFLKDYAEVEEDKVYRLATMNDFWSHDEIPVTGISNEGNINLKRGKKPEKLLQRIIEMSTVPGDIILDYHLGSGTTAAVALKLGRRFVGIEQLDYGDEDSLRRLQNVINGDTTGISSEINWKGGSSFVYLELAKNNLIAIEKIKKCKSQKDLIKLFDELYGIYFLSYNVKIKEFKEKVSKEKEFQNLSLDRQKEIYAKMVDLNQLYVNLSDMEDSQFKLSEEDIALTNDFYHL